MQEAGPTRAPPPSKSLWTHLPRVADRAAFCNLTFAKGRPVSLMSRARPHATTAPPRVAESFRASGVRLTLRDPGSGRIRESARPWARPAPCRPQSRAGRRFPATRERRDGRCRRPSPVTTPARSRPAPGECRWCLSYRSAPTPAAPPPEPSPIGQPLHRRRPRKGPAGACWPAAAPSGGRHKQKNPRPLTGRESRGATRWGRQQAPPPLSRYLPYASYPRGLALREPTQIAAAYPRPAAPPGRLEYGHTTVRDRYRRPLSGASRHAHSPGGSLGGPFRRARPPGSHAPRLAKDRDLRLLLLRIARPRR